MNRTQQKASFVVRITLLSDEVRIFPEGRFSEAARISHRSKGIRAWCEFHANQNSLAALRLPLAKVGSLRAHSLKGTFEGWFGQGVRVDQFVIKTDFDEFVLDLLEGRAERVLIALEGFCRSSFEIAEPIQAHLRSQLLPLIADSVLRGRVSVRIHFRRTRAKRNIDPRILAVLVESGAASPPTREGLTVLRHRFRKFFEADDLALIEQLWNVLPRSYKSLKSLQAAHFNLLIHKGSLLSAEQVVKKAWAMPDDPGGSVDHVLAACESRIMWLLARSTGFTDVDQVTALLKWALEPGETGRLPQQHRVSTLIRLATAPVAQDSQAVKDAIESLGVKREQLWSLAKECEESHYRAVTSTPEDDQISRRSYLPNYAHIVAVGHVHGFQTNAQGLSRILPELADLCKEEPSYSPAFATLVLLLCILKANPVRDVAEHIAKFQFPPGGMPITPGALMVCLSGYIVFQQDRVLRRRYARELWRQIRRSCPPDLDEPLEPILKLAPDNPFLVELIRHCAHAEAYPLSPSPDRERFESEATDWAP